MKSIIALAGSLAIAAFGSLAAIAQEYPVHEVTLVVPYTAGGPTDLLARALADALSAKWQKPVVIDNRPGASETIAAEAVVHAAPDGYTLLFGADPTFSANMYLFKNLPYDTDKDLAPIIQLANVYMGLSIPSSLSVTTVKEFVDMVAKAPRKYSYGSTGIGTTTHLAMDEFARDNNLKMIHVPYKGTSQVAPDLAAGRVHAMLSNGLVVLPFIKTGKVRMLVFAGPARNPAFPEVPTFTEAGYPNMSAGFYYGLAAPAGTPKGVIDKIANDVRDVIADKDFVAKHFAPLGLIPAATTQEDFLKFIAQERTTMKARVEKSGVQLN